MEEEERTDEAAEGSRSSLRGIKSASYIGLRTYILIIDYNDMLKYHSGLLLFCY